MSRKAVSIAGLAATLIMLVSIGAMSSGAPAPRGYESKPAFAAPVAVAAATSEGEPADAGDSEVLTLEAATDRALQENLELQHLEREVDAARRARDQARAHLPGSLLQADYQYDLAGLQLGAARRALELEVFQAYFGVQLAQSALQVRKEAVSEAEELLRVAREAVDAGLRSRVDLLSAENALVQAGAALEAAETELEVAWLKLNQVMNTPFDARWRLTTLLLQNHPYDVDLDDAIAAAVERDTAVRIAERDRQLYEDMAQGSRQGAARAKRRAAAQQVELQVREAYARMWSAYEQVDARRKSLELAEEGRRLARLRFEAGLGTHADVLSASRQWSEAELAHLQALMELNATRAQFRILTEG